MRRSRLVENAAELHRGDHNGAPWCALGTSILMTVFNLRHFSRSRAAPRERLRSGEMRPLRVSSMRSLAIVRDLVKRVLRARKNLKIRNYPDEDDDDPD
jgi:hypothetical protein